MYSRTGEQLQLYPSVEQNWLMFLIAKYALCNRERMFLSEVSPLFHYV